MRIFFDVDGVIMDNIHSRKGWIKRWDENLQKDLGIHPGDFQEVFREWFPAVLLGKAGFEEEMERWLESRDYGVGARRVIDYWNEKDTNVNEAVYGAVRDLALTGKADLYLATNQTHERARYLWDVFGFKACFKDIYYSARLGCFKSDPRFFADIEKDLGFDPRCDPPLYFDDDSRNIDVSAARGWNAVPVDGPEDILDHPFIRELLCA